MLLPWLIHHIEQLPIPRRGCSFTVICLLLHAIQLAMTSSMLVMLDCAILRCLPQTTTRIEGSLMPTLALRTPEAIPQQTSKQQANSYKVYMLVLTAGQSKLAPRRYLSVLRGRHVLGGVKGKPTGKPSFGVIFLIIPLLTHGCL